MSNQKSHPSTANNVILILIILLLFLSLSLSVVLFIERDYGIAMNTVEEVKGFAKSLSFEEKEQNNNLVNHDLVNYDSANENFLNIDLRDYALKYKDTVGWIKIDSLGIDMPVVKDGDNEFYLTHDINKEHNKHGWLFMDYRNNSMAMNKNTIIYGHNYKDSMFGNLVKLLEPDFFAKNSDTFLFQTRYYSYKMQIFSVYVTDDTESYIQTDFTDAEHGMFIHNAKENNQVPFLTTDLSSGTRVLTLSTCYKNSSKRLVVQAKIVAEKKL